MIYVSHDTGAQEAAAGIMSACAAAGANVWRPAMQQGDPSFLAQRREAIRRASLFIVALNAPYAASMLCRNELKAAQQAGVRCVTVVVGSFDSSVRQFVDEFRLDQPLEYETPAFASRLGAALERAGLVAPKRQASAAAGPPAVIGDGRFFINFSNRDREHVTYLRSALERANIPVWDYIQGSRDFQKALAHEIEQAIGESNGVLCVVTENWRNSDWVLREYLYARELKKPTFLLQFEPITPTLVISERTLIDFMSDRAGGLRQLEREIEEMRQ